MLFFGGGGVLDKLRDYSLLIFLFSLIPYFHRNCKKQMRKIIRVFWISSLICHIVLSIFFSFHESEYNSEFLRSSDRKGILLIMLVVPPLLFTLFWWWFTRGKRGKHNK
jgi:hypothetical protein